MIENRQTGYRWFVKSDYPRIELETPDVTASTPLYVDLTLEEAVALELAAAGKLPEDRRGAQLLEQAAARLRLEIDPVRRGLCPQPSLFERQIHFPKRGRRRKQQS